MQSFGTILSLNARAFDSFTYDVFVGGDGVATGYSYSAGGNVDIEASPDGCILEINRGGPQDCLAAREVITTFIASDGPDVASVPLPAGGLLLGFGMLGLGLMRRRLT